MPDLPTGPIPFTARRRTAVALGRAVTHDEIRLRARTVDEFLDAGPPVTAQAATADPTASRTAAFRTWAALRSPAPGAARTPTTAGR
ncbi:hypothetical protein ACGF1Z_03315 [Streptomyces sp. NPDC048018]|uniref:hypothetical protein n=1 Tax=Streptomyces sp. NPDC048018 TaxID=3365499 RepID=UPI0037245093